MASYKLPKPDNYGNFWLGRRTSDPEKGKEADPAVFKSKRLDGDAVKDSGEFVAFLGSKRGFLFEGGSLEKFRTAEDALAAINNLVS